MRIRPEQHQALWAEATYEAGVAHLRNCWERGLWRSIESPGDYAILANRTKDESQTLVSPFAVMGPTIIPAVDYDPEGEKLIRNACFIGSAAIAEIFAEWDRLGLVPEHGAKMRADDWPERRLAVHPKLTAWARRQDDDPLEWPKTPVGMLYLSLIMHGWWVPIIEPCDPSDVAAVLEESLDPDTHMPGGRTGRIIGLGQAHESGERTNRYSKAIHQYVGISWRPEVGQQLLRDVILCFALGPMVAYYIFSQADGPMLDKLLAITPLTFGKVVDTAETDIPLNRFHQWADSITNAWQTRIYTPTPDPADEFVSDPELVKRLSKLPDVVIHDRTVESFLTLQTEMQRAAIQGNRASIDAAVCCRDARVIQFRPEIVDRVIGEVGSYVETLIERHKEPDDTPQTKYERVHEMAATLPFPEHLPFENMFFGWGDSVPTSAGVRILVSQLVERDTVTINEDHWPRHEDGFVACYLLGILVTSRDDGSAWLVIENKTRDTRLLLSLAVNGAWYAASATHAPWLLAWFVSAINAHSALNLETSHRLRRQRHLQRYAKAIGKRPVPRPYYTVVLTPGMMKVRRTIVNSMPREWRHRWDVLGHFARRIERGPLPLSERDIRDLTTRKYRIFTRLNMPDSDALEALMWTQESPPGEGEWVAIQKIWRTAYIKGPADKPYIPSVHQLGRKKKRGERRA
jgi:hypothetical protein